jgi:hypothetical protein
MVQIKDIKEPAVLIEWVASECLPELAYPENVLENWAIKNGWHKDDNLFDLNSIRWLENLIYPNRYRCLDENEYTKKNDVIVHQNGSEWIIENGFTNYPVSEYLFVQKFANEYNPVVAVLRKEN